jgi:hypothetical protein
MEETGMKRNALDVLLGRMAKDGKIQRLGKGLYAHLDYVSPPANPPNKTKHANSKRGTPRRSVASVRSSKVLTDLETEVPSAQTQETSGQKPSICPSVQSVRENAHDAATAATETVRWHDRLATRIVDWFHGDRGWEEARRLAWGDVENEWHDLHGRRWPSWQCAGCNAPLSGSQTLSLPDGNRVHFEPIDCLIRFGKRWRGDASEALVALGLAPPKSLEVALEAHEQRASSTERAR